VEKDQEIIEQIAMKWLNEEQGLPAIIAAEILLDGNNVISTEAKFVAVFVLKNLRDHGMDPQP
jgi:hypothetical protein